MIRLPHSKGLLTATLSLAAALACGCSPLTLTRSATATAVPPSVTSTPPPGAQPAVTAPTPAAAALLRRASAAFPSALVSLRIGRAPSSVGGDTAGRWLIAVHVHTRGANSARADLRAFWDAEMIAVNYNRRCRDSGAPCLNAYAVTTPSGKGLGQASGTVGRPRVPKISASPKAQIAEIVQKAEQAGLAPGSIRVWLHTFAGASFPELEGTAVHPAAFLEHDGVFADTPFAGTLMSVRNPSGQTMYVSALSRAPNSGRAWILAKYAADAPHFGALSAPPSGGG